MRDLYSVFLRTTAGSELETVLRCCYICIKLPLKASLQRREHSSPWYRDPGVTSQQVRARACLQGGHLPGDPKTNPERGGGAVSALPPAASGAPLRGTPSCNAPALPGALERLSQTEPGK